MKQMSNNPVRIPIRRLENYDGLPLPMYQSSGAVGMDLHAAVTEDVIVEPNAILPIPCGIAIAVPVGFEAQIRPRSGLATTHGISVVNTPGTVDPDYRGEIKVLLINHGSKPFRISRGMRIAQIVVCPIVRTEWEDVDDLPPSSRDECGFGHTGI